MQLEALFHKGKSNMAYAFDQKTIYLWFQTKKDDVKKVTLIAGDPFMWGPKKDNPEVWEWIHTTCDETAMEKKYSTDLFDYYFIAYQPPYKRVKYAFVVEDDNERYLYGTGPIIKLSENDPRMYNLFNYFNFPCINPSDVMDTPSWVKDTIWYQIFPDRFAKGVEKENVLEWGSVPLHVKNSMVFGGDIKGIISKLDYLKDLGINGIYFNPIFEAKSTHKYDTTDYYKIDPIFGTNEDFKELVEECHKRGIKIMLDAVFNHCGWYHPYWIDVVKNGKNSPYYECFNCRLEPIINFELEDGHPPYDHRAFKEIPNYDTFAFTPFMPKWNTDNKKTREHLLDVTRYWTEEYHIDGWRLDVSNEVSHDFWREFKRVVRSINKDTVIIGENWDDSTPWLLGDQMDAVMNYGLQYPLSLFFGNGDLKINAHEFQSMINSLFIRYQYNVSCNMFNLIDCHDTARTLYICQENKDLAKLIYIFLFTFTGAPNLYYGDEIGLSGGNDPENRRCMIWDEDKQDLDMKAFFKKLISLRHSHQSFKEVDLEWLIVDDSGLIGYQKKSENEIINVYLNNSNTNQKINLEKPFINLFTNEIIEGECTIPSYGHLLLQQK